MVNRLAVDMGPTDFVSPRLRTCLVAVSASLALACQSSLGNFGRTVDAQSTCAGRCSPTLAARANGQVAAIWSAEDGRTWVQRIDAEAWTIAGAAIDVGQLATGSDAFAEQPHALALSNGDLVLVGMLANGRVTFARASRTPVRRVAPKVIVPSTNQPVLELAAAESGSGFDLLLLYGPAGYDPGSREPPPHMDAELRELGPTGELLRKPLRWRTACGFQPRLASCSGIRYLAWESAGRLIVTRVDRDGRRAPERAIEPRRSLGSPGPIACRGENATLTTSSKRNVFSVENRPELSLVDLSPASWKFRWRTLKLPAAPREVLADGGRLSALVHAGHLYVTLAGEVHDRIARIDLQTNAVRMLPILLPPNQTECLALADESRAVCATRTPLTSEPSCTNARARVSFTFVGGSPDEDEVDDTPFWSAGVIDDPGAPSESERSRRRARIYCGEPAWAELREALASWCEDGANTDFARARAVYCSPDAEYSFLYQATHCTNLSASCPASKLAVVPSVDRAAFLAGARIELSYLNCSVFFGRKAGRLRVIDRECTGD